MKILVSEKFRNLYPLISVFLILVIGFANINNDLNVVLFYIGFGISVGLVLIYALNFRAIKKQMLILIIALAIIQIVVFIFFNTLENHELFLYFEYIPLIIVLSANTLNVIKKYPPPQCLLFVFEGYRTGGQLKNTSHYF